MKKVLIGILLVLFMYPMSALAVVGDSSWTETEPYNFSRSTTRVIKLVWTSFAHATGGVSEYALCTDANVESIDGWYLDYIGTDPSGTTAPTALYDIAFYDAKGDVIRYDIMNTNANDRSATVYEIALPYLNDGIYGTYQIVSGASVVITNNTAQAAQGTIWLYFYK